MGSEPMWMWRRAKLVALVGLLALAMAVLTACGAGDDDSAAVVSSKPGGASGFGDVSPANVDAQLLNAYRAATATPVDTAAIEALAQFIELRDVGGVLHAGVLVRGSATEAALETAGMRVTAHVGGTFGGLVPVLALPALASVSGVERIAASGLFSP